MRFPLRRGELITRSGDTLTDAEIDELWRFRDSIYPIRTEVIEQDRRKFAAWARRARAAQIRDDSGQLRGFWLARLEPFDAAGVPVLLFMPEYAFVDPAFRGSAWTTIAAFELLVCHLTEVRSHRIWLAGVGYPTSISVIAHYVPEVYISGDDAPPQPAAILDWLHRQAGDAWEPARHRVRLPTCPAAPAPRTLARWQHEPCVMRALARNPAWQRGYGVGVVARLSPRALARLALGVLRGGRRRATPL